MTQQPLTDPQADERNTIREAEALFDSGVKWLLCRRMGARNWVEQTRGDAVAWIARAMQGGATVTRRGSDCRVKAGNVTFVFRPHGPDADQHTSVAAASGGGR